MVIRCLYTEARVSIQDINVLVAALALWHGSGYHTKL